MSALAAPLILVRELKEFKYASIFLFLGLLGFIVFLVMQLSMTNLCNYESDFQPLSELMFPNSNEWYTLISGLPTILVGFGYHTYFFPILGSL